MTTENSKELATPVFLQSVKNTLAGAEMDRMTAARAAAITGPLTAAIHSTFLDMATEQPSFMTTAIGRPKFMDLAAKPAFIDSALGRPSFMDSIGRSFAESTRLAGSVLGPDSIPAIAQANAAIEAVAKASVLDTSVMGHIASAGIAAAHLSATLPEVPEGIFTAAFAENPLSSLIAPTVPLPDWLPFVDDLISGSSFEAVAKTDRVEVWLRTTGGDLVNKRDAMWWALHESPDPVSQACNSAVELVIHSLQERGVSDARVRAWAETSPHRNEALAPIEGGGVRVTWRGRFYYAAHLAGFDAVVVELLLSYADLPRTLHELKHVEGEPGKELARVQLERVEDLLMLLSEWR